MTRPSAGVASDLDTRVARAVARWGLRPRRWTRLTRRGPVSGPRVAYRLELDDGRVVKARRCVDEARAREVWRIRRHLRFDGIARIHAQDGPVLLEEWVEGTPLARGDGTAEHVVQAATMLGRLHSVERIDGRRARSTSTTAEWLEQAERDLDLLAARQALPGDLTRMLQAAARRLDPGVTVAGVVHRDLCAENLIRKGDGRIVVIDNERLGVGSLDYDLGRVWCRWPMPAPAWELFRQAYEVQRGEGPTDRSLLVWKIAASAHSAALRVLAGPEELEEPLARLRELEDDLERAG